MTTTSHIYFAAPLFSAAELRFNQHIVAAIEEIVPVFLPQRDGGLLIELRAQGMDIRAASEQIAAIDLHAVESSMGLVAVLDGQSIDEGVAFEIGYAYALGKPCIALQTDPRRTTLGFSNPMILSAMAETATTEAELLASIHRQILRQ